MTAPPTGHSLLLSLYVVDALVWRGYSLMDCSAEFRAFWLKGALPAKGKEYPGLGYKRLRDKPPKALEQQQQPAEAQSNFW
ncbi:uncharacterized protein HaLaN_11772, partial [Haematococcus lacustris]